MAVKSKNKKSVKKPAKKNVKPTKKVNKKAVKPKAKKPILIKKVDTTQAFAKGGMGVTAFPGGLAAFVHRNQPTPPAPVAQPAPVAEQPKTEQPTLASNVDTNPPPKAEKPSGISDQPHPMMDDMPPEILALMEQARRMGGTGVVIIDMGTRSGTQTPEEIEDTLLRDVAKMVDGIYGSNLSKRVSDLITAVRKG